MNVFPYCGVMLLYLAYCIYKFDVFVHKGQSRKAPLFSIISLFNSLHMTVIFVTILKCMLINIMKVNKDIVIIKLLSVHTVE